MQEINLDQYLRDLFEEKRKERQEREELCAERIDYVDDYIESLDVMIEFEQTLSERQRKMFQKINLYNLRYYDECEFLAFKSGYMTALEHNKRKSKEKED